MPPAQLGLGQGRAAVRPCKQQEPRAGEHVSPANDCSPGLPVTHDLSAMLSLLGVLIRRKVFLLRTANSGAAHPFRPTTATTAKEWKDPLPLCEAKYPCTNSQMWPSTTSSICSAKLLAASARRGVSYCAEL